MQCSVMLDCPEIMAYGLDPQHTSHLKHPLPDNKAPYTGVLYIYPSYHVMGYDSLLRFRRRSIFSASFGAVSGRLQGQTAIHIPQA